MSVEDGTKRASSLSSMSSLVKRGVLGDSDEVPWTPSTCRRNNLEFKT